jgi:hypothetical protein
MSTQVQSAARDPHDLLSEVRAIVAVANREDRDLSTFECVQCERLLAAAEALANLTSAPPTVGRATA